VLDEDLVGPLCVLDDLFLFVASLLVVVGSARDAIVAATRWCAGSELEFASLVRHQAGSGESVVLIFSHQMPRQHGQLAGRRHHGGLEAAAGLDALGAGALAARRSGWLFDRTRGRILVGLPLLVAAVPVLAFAGSPLIAIAGVLLWGVAAAVMDSSIKALVADLVPALRLATAYGVFAAIQGAAAIGGGVMAGALYERSLRY
jgi:hypothetical protein